MTTPNINTQGVQISQGAQEITSIKAKSNENGQSFMDAMSNVGKPGGEKERPEIQDVRASDNRKEERAEPKSENDTKVRTEGASDNTKEEVKGNEAKTVKEDSLEEKKIPEEKVSDEEVSAIVEAVSDIKDKIITELDITEDDLEQVMETLGITEADLLNPRVMTDIVAEIKDVTPVDIVSSDELSQIITDLQGEVRQITSDLVQELDMTPEEFKNTLAELKNEYEVISPGPETDEIMKNPEMIKEETGKDFSEMVRTPAEATGKGEDHTDRTGRISVEEGNEVNLEKPVRPDADPNQSQMNDNGREGAGRDQMQRTIEPQQMTQDKQTGNISRSESEVRVSDGAEIPSHANTTINSGNVFFQNLTNAVENTLENIANTQEAGQTTTMPDAMDLIDQINSQVRAVIDNETQSLSMQLHPESLGRLNIEIVSKGGQITAQLEAENASVKTALEAHVEQLKETLEQRGLRVESVEVSVATHEFEQNFMNGQNSGDTMNEPEGRPRTRSINLNDAEALESEEEMDEEARITRDMMAANGNSVDYLA